MQRESTMNMRKKILFWRKRWPRKQFEYSGLWNSSGKFLPDFTVKYASFLKHHKTKFNSPQCSAGEISQRSHLEWVNSFTQRDGSVENWDRKLPKLISERQEREYQFVRSELMASYWEVLSFCCRCEGGWLQLEGSARVCGRNQRFDRPVVLFSDKPVATLHMQWVQYLHRFISVSERFLRCHFVKLKAISSPLERTPPQLPLIYLCITNISKEEFSTL